MTWTKPIIRLKNMKAVKENFDYFTVFTENRQAQIAPVLKSDAYGLGIDNVAPVLYESGARIFFTSDQYEAQSIRQALPSGAQDVDIYMLHGFHPRNKTIEDNVYPVLNNMDEFIAYHNVLTENNILSRKAAVQFNTGMNRSGFNMDEYRTILSNDAYSRIDVTVHMTHLCAVELDHNAEQQHSLDQLEKFRTMMQELPEKPVSVTATHGSLYLQHLNKMPVEQNIERIGVGLYGDIPGHDLAFEAMARIMSVTRVKAGEKIGYDYTYTADRDMKIAIIDIGYGDGYPREASVSDGHEGEKAFMTIAGNKAEIVGLIAMNMTCVDVTDIDDTVLNDAEYAEIVGKDTPVYHLATCAKTNIEDIMISLNRHNVRAADYIIS